MGVPGFFSWILKNYRSRKDLILKSLDIKTNILYLDANCLVHPQCFKILEEYKLKVDTVEELENIMMKRVITYIKELVINVRPDKLYIAIDGVAPMAKINQQRKRRFMSAMDYIEKKKIKEEYIKSCDREIEWSNVVITPGTKFMEKLHEHLLRYSVNNKIETIYSSYHEPGEGEHKILQHIKKSKPENIVVYGLDADLLFLSLASNRNNIHLMREADYIKGKKTNIDLESTNFNYVSIDRLRYYINLKMNELVDLGKGNKKGSVDKIEELEENISFNYVDDFIFICYLLGNDFLPHIPSVNIKTGSLDYLINNYVQVYNKLKEHLILGSDINYKFLKLYINQLSKCEDYYFREIYPKYKERIKTRTHKITLGESEEEFKYKYKIEIWNYENMKGKYEPNKVYMYRNINSYKHKYYYEHFKISNQKEFINRLCKEYIIGLEWVSKYYFDECPSWEWQFPMTHGPFMSDLSYYLKHNTNDNNVFNKSKPLSPMTQLLLVIPPLYNHILPKNYRFLTVDIDSPIIDLYPVSVKLDDDKEMRWESIPYLPLVDVRRVEKTIKNIKLSKKEMIRN